MPQWTRYGTVTATAHLAADQLAEAQAEIAQGLSMATERNARGYQAPLLRLRAEVLGQLESTEPGDAVRCLEEALALATNLSMRPEAAQCHLDLGKLYARTANRPKAEEHLTTAATLYREMDMGFWLTQAETVLGPLS